MLLDYYEKAVGMQGRAETERHELAQSIANFHARLGDAANSAEWRSR